MSDIQDRRIQLYTADAAKEIQEIGRKVIKIMTPGGNKLSLDQAAELAVAVWVTGANPANQEIYWMDTVGPYLGYQYHSRKAHEQLHAEDPTIPPQIWFEERLATHSEALFDESKGDIAWTMVLHDSVTRAHWLGKFTELFTMFTSKGMDAKQAGEFAERMLGPEPTWQASAVVYGDEHFTKEVWEKDAKGVAHATGVYKPEKWDRNERCKKRAQKWSLRKRFSNMQLPDPEMGETIIDADAREIIASVSSELRAEIIASVASELRAEPTSSTTPRSAAQNLKELGFEPEPRVTTKVASVPPEPEPPPYPQSTTVEVIDPRPWAPEELKRQIEAKAEEYLGKRCNPIYRNIIAKVVGTTLQDSDKSTKRYELFKWLVGNSSTKEWEECVVNAVQWWIGVTDYNDRPPAYVEQEIINAHEYALAQAGQMQLPIS